MIASRYVVGIDLGTTNTAVAYVDLSRQEESSQDSPAIERFPIPQVVAEGEVKERPLLPSFIYIPGPHELPEGSLALPWKEDASTALGEFARDHGARLPHRLISSSKSWLCNANVDRRGEILPWKAEGDVDRISPLDASIQILQHIRQAWDQAMAADDDTLCLARQEVILTVPASFDAAARELTAEAARTAGLENVTLLEEPQSALYAWLASHPRQWREQVSVGDCILVCDIGGGTTDFCVVSVSEEEGNLVLSRVAVGDHLLLGGDNMDLALALHLESRHEEDTEGDELDPWQLAVLVHACREAKEALLQDPSLEAFPVVIPGRGSGVVGGTIRLDLTRQDVETIVVQGFLPECQASDEPLETPDMGLQEFGLPYASDAGITRHLAAFLSRHAGAGAAREEDSPAGGAGFLAPSAVLYNGGVLQAEVLADRLTHQLSSWVNSSGYQDHAVARIPNPDPSSAVALGAAYYGWTRRGQGVRIRGGTSRSYYIGVEEARPAVPGVSAPLRGLCVAPRGMEEGTGAELPDREFTLVVGQPTRFRFFSSTTRRDDEVGSVIRRPERELAEIEPVQATLPAEDDGQGRIPVSLETRVTEVGTLELWFVNRSNDHRWKLEFNVRERADTAA